jgi:hypothetical protein
LIQGRASPPVLAPLFLENNIMSRIRVLKNIVGTGIDYRPGDVLVNLSTSAAAALVAAGDAVNDVPSPSGSMYTLFNNAGFIPVTPAASGYVGPSGQLMDAVGTGLFYMPDDHTVTAVYPGRFEVTYDILKLRPRLN